MKNDKRLGIQKKTSKSGKKNQFDWLENELLKNLKIIL